MSRNTEGGYKRPRGSPTFLTPTNPVKRIPRRLLHSEERTRLARRRILDTGFPSLAPASSSSSADNRRVRGPCWTDAEVKALVEFILFSL